MNERERFHRVFRGQPVDRPPLLDEGVREEVLEGWQKQGMPAGRTHLEIFGLTPHENVGPDVRFSSRYAGRVLTLRPREYRHAFRVSDDRFPEDWIPTVRRLYHREHIVCVWASRGFFQALGVGDWPTFRQALLEVARHPVRVRNRMEIYSEFCARMLEKTLLDVDPDFLYLSEPISDNQGPLISPDMFEEFMIPVYREIIGVARAHGIEHFLVNTYGNTAKLLPAMIRAGVNILWVSEAAETPDMDYRALRRRHGPGLGLIGGIPLSLLRPDSEQGMSDRLREIVVPLLESGRYIPLAGGRVREEVSWPVYKRYRRTLADIIG
jgi:hypothetical protein